MALVVRASQAVAEVEECRRRFDPAARQAMPAHITVLYPFVTADEYGPHIRTALAGVLAEHPPFDYSLCTLGRFPGVVYLAPEPAQPFVELTEAIAGRLGLPPYGGRFDTVVPHLTVAMGRRLPRRHTRALRAALPIRSEARTIEVLAEEDRGWALVDSLPLGGGA
jgi:2'-5' RNA ligase